jgi:hypothetical protein
MGIKTTLGEYNAEPSLRVSINGSRETPDPLRWYLISDRMRRRIARVAIVQVANFKSVTRLKSYSLSANRRRCSGLSVC